MSAVTPRRTPTGRLRALRALPAGGAGARVAARAAHRGARALRERGLPDAARRGLALHERGAARARPPSARPTRARRAPRRGLERCRRRRRRGRRSSSSTAASRRAVARRALPAGVDAASLRDALAAAPGRASAAGSGAAATGRPFAALNTALPRRRRLRASSRRRGRGDARSTCVFARRGARGPPRATRATSSSPARAAQCHASSRPTPGRRRRAYLTNAVTEMVARRRRRRRPLQAAARGRRRRSTSATLAVRQGARRRFLDHSIALGAALSRNDIDVRFDGRRRRVRARRPLHGRRPQLVDTPHADRPRAAALHEPGALQGRPRRPGARRLPRPHPRAPGRAEDRRQADRTATCCSRARRSSTRSRSSRSSPTT